MGVQHLGHRKAWCRKADGSGLDCFCGSRIELLPSPSTPLNLTHVDTHSCTQTQKINRHTHTATHTQAQTHTHFLSLSYTHTQKHTDIHISYHSTFHFINPFSLTRGNFLRPARLTMLASFKQNSRFLETLPHLQGLMHGNSCLPSSKQRLQLADTRSVLKQNINLW